MVKSRILPEGLCPAILCDADASVYVGVAGRNLDVVTELDKPIVALPVNEGSANEPPRSRPPLRLAEAGCLSGFKLSTRGKG